ncbi:hypothetical protein BaRGS_00039104 [Batillaria attramentaria]|uniref:RBPJ-interacting and tubulin-associated protein 1 n=1 Tax=Batillaria attramentaria TaxID=370345 RepID=A0ABD0J401_9CAEN
MDDDFVVRGKQVAKLSTQRPFTASSKDFGYYRKLPYSSVDETLFQTHHPSALDAPVSFPAPWEKKKPQDGKSKTKTFVKRGPPLLWAPAPSERIANDHNSSNKSFLSQTINGVPLTHQYRHLKHTPTFVDETLFGDPLSEPSFKAPWEEKKKTKKQILNWYPDQTEEKPRRRRRPATALGLRSTTVSSSLPVWKP